MKIILALVCFIAMMLHAFFGYFLYTRGETVFEPENMIVAIEKKAPSEKDRFAIFRKKAAPAAVQSAVSEPKEQAIPTTENTVTEIRTDEIFRRHRNCSADRSRSDCFES